MSTIYVMGPYSAHSREERQQNTDNAMFVGVELIKKGHDPFIPHLTHYLDEFAQSHGILLPNEFWYRYDFHWMPLCEAGYYIASSPGADNEHRIMEALGRTIYSRLEDVPDISGTVHANGAIDLTAFKTAIQGCVEALEYVERAHPDQVTGIWNRRMQIRRARQLLGRAP